MAKPVAIFQHAANEGPGKLLSLLERRGLEFQTIFWPDPDVPAQRAEDFSGCIILGGAMNIYQHRDHPWLVQEKALLSDFLAAELPVLGICLGAQLIADALGGKVFQNPSEEIGWWPVQFSDAAGELFPSLPVSATVLHWHGDTFCLPDGARRLATSAACENQAFVFGHRIVGLQFHPEVDMPLARDFCCTDGEFHWPDGEWVQSKNQLLDATPAHQAETDAILHAVFDFLFPASSSPTTPSNR